VTAPIKRIPWQSYRCGHDESQMARQDRASLIF
jgi:hypothetical protein